MWDVFEQPWTLLGAAVIVFLIVQTIRSVWPEKNRWWQLLLPVLVAALGIGLDLAVATDHEKINAIVKAGIRAAEAEDCTALARLIASDYEDSYHKSKAELIGHCRSRLEPPSIEKVRKIASDVQVTPPEAVATFTIMVQFHKDSYWAKAYKPSALVVLEFRLHKQPDGSWLVYRAEVKEVDKMPVNWGAAWVPPAGPSVAMVMPGS